LPEPGDLEHVWDLYVISLNKIEFELTLTTSRLTCRAPNERLCPSFELALTEIDEISSDDKGSVQLETKTGSNIDLALARNFGAPVKNFIDEIARKQPLVSWRQTAT
jgi:hypothetical protein